MAGTTRGTPSPLDKGVKTRIELDLLKEGKTFSFFQAIRLLKHLAIMSGTGGKPADVSGSTIRIRPNLSLGFPASDIEKIEEIEADRRAHYEVTANFLGLYGSASPLPTFYTEELIDEENEDESISRDFSDILNHQLFGLLYQCWSKYRLQIKTIEEGSLGDLERLFCLMGLGGKTIRKHIPDPYRLLRYIGLFAQFPRSALGLKTLLQDASGDIPLDVIPCVQRKAPIPKDQQLCLGASGCTLGRDSYIGGETVDRMGKFRIQIGPLDESTASRISPGSHTYQQIKLLTDMYTVDPMEYDVAMILKQDALKSVCLGDTSRATLGVSSWIFSGDYLKEAKIVYAMTN